MRLMPTAYPSLTYTFLEVGRENSIPRFISNPPPPTLYFTGVVVIPFLSKREFRMANKQNCSTETGK